MKQQQKEILEQILKTLNDNKVRATYGAVGKLLGLPAISVGARLGPRRHEASWVVSAKSEMPSGYLPAERHPDLKKHATVISSPAKLRELLSK